MNMQDSVSSLSGNIPVSTADASCQKAASLKLLGQQTTLKATPVF